MEQVGIGTDDQRGGAVICMERTVDGVVLAVGFEFEALGFDQSHQGHLLLDSGHCFV